MTESRSPKVPGHGASPQRLAAAINAIASGRSDARGSLTLAANTVRTVVQLADFLEVAEVSTIFLTPRTATAAATPWFIEAKGNSTFTIGHDSSAATDRDFDAGWIG